MRVLYRICHFIVYAILLLVKFIRICCQYYLNKARWALLMVIFKFNEEEIMQTCTFGNRLGDKRLSHTAIIVNNLEIIENNPPVAQMTKLAEIITWLMISQSTNKEKVADQHKLITLFDKAGQTDQFSDLLYALIKIRLAIDTRYTCKMTQDKTKN